MSIRAGDLNSRVEVQSPVRTASATGEPTTEWGTVATVWAAISPASGAALRNAGTGEMAGAAFALGTVKVVLRFLAGVAPGWRLLQASGVILEINYVADVANRHVDLELRCSEVQ